MKSLLNRIFGPANHFDSDELTFKLKVPKRAIKFGVSIFAFVDPPFHIGSLTIDVPKASIKNGYTSFRLADINLSPEAMADFQNELNSVIKPGRFIAKVEIEISTYGVLSSREDVIYFDITTNQAHVWFLGIEARISSHEATPDLGEAINDKIKRILQPFIGTAVELNQALASQIVTANDLQTRLSQSLDDQQASAAEAKEVFRVGKDALDENTKLHGKLTDELSGIEKLKGEMGTAIDSLRNMIGKASEIETRLDTELRKDSERNLMITDLAERFRLEIHEASKLTQEVTGLKEGCASIKKELEEYLVRAEKARKSSEEKSASEADMQERIKQLAAIICQLSKELRERTELKNAELAAGLDTREKAQRSQNAQGSLLGTAYKIYECAWK